MSLLSQTTTLAATQFAIDPQYYPIIVAALVISILGAALSVFVVLKRLAFIGQGVSHAAFGGVGIALVLGVHGAIGQLGIVVAFSVLAALWIAAISRSQRGRTDTAIGVVLSASMALGFVLFTVAESGHEHDEQGHAHGEHADGHHLIEEILFGNILDTSWTNAWVAVAVSAGIGATLWFTRRKLVFWAFDEPVCDAYGVSSRRMTDLFLVLLALTVVMSMQIAGVVLAAAMLVLPGAGALNLSAKLSTVFVYAFLIAIVGAIAGLFAGLEGGYPVGPSIVLAQSVLYLASLLVRVCLVRLRS